MADEHQNGVMTLGELASYLKLPKSTLYKQVQEGKIPGQNQGKKLVNSGVSVGTLSITG